jgi:hypothetical protein
VTNVSQPTFCLIVIHDKILDLNGFLTIIQQRAGLLLDFGRMLNFQNIISNIISRKSEAVQ